MQAALKMQAVGDTKRETAYAEQWAKGGPNRRLTKKSMPRAQDAVPRERVTSSNAANKMEDLLEDSRNKIRGLPREFPDMVLRSVFADSVAKTAEKRGLGTSAAAAVAAIAGMTLNPDPRTRRSHNK